MFAFTRHKRDGKGRRTLQERFAANREYMEREEVLHEHPAASSKDMEQDFTHFVSNFYSMLSLSASMLIST